MINIVYERGCYGNFLARCIYYFSKPRYDQERIDFLFDDNGSSHIMRKNKKLKKNISVEHYSNTTIIDSRTIVIQTDELNYLDYYDNQFIKQSGGILKTAIDEIYGFHETQKKLNTMWQLHGSDNAEKWMLRELFSFSIVDILNANYSYNPPHYVSITTNDLINNLYSTLSILSDKLDIKLHLDLNVVNSIEMDFRNSQTFHNIQQRCVKWVNDILNDKMEDCPCITLFDEAYVQSFLRINNCHLKCDGLNTLPNSMEMRDLIY